MNEELKVARKAAEAAARKHGFSLEEVTGGTSASKKTARSPAPAKFKNPDNASQTWSGRGRQPEWYKSAIAGGKKPEDLKI